MWLYKHVSLLTIALVPCEGSPLPSCGSLRANVINTMQGSVTLEIALLVFVSVRLPIPKFCTISCM